MPHLAGRGSATSNTGTAKTTAAAKASNKSNTRFIRPFRHCERSAAIHDPQPPASTPRPAKPAASRLAKRRVFSISTCKLQPDNALESSIEFGKRLQLTRSDDFMEHMIQLHIEKLPEGVYLATSDDVQGLVAQGRTIQETIEIARDVAKKLMEAMEDVPGTHLVPVREVFDYPLIVAT
jgi:predicted RNase H-like HicB family nuclease